MIKLLKKGLAYALSVMMILSVFAGVTALGAREAYAAEGDVAENTTTGATYATVYGAFDAATSGDTIRLIADVTEYDIRVDSGKEITLDLNGYGIDGGGSGTVIIVSGTLTITDNGTGGYITGGNARYGGAISISNDGTLNINGGTLRGNTATRGGGAISNDGTLNINGGTLTGNTATNGGAIYTAGPLNINGGTLTGNTATSYGGAIYVNFGELNMAGGTLTENQATYGGGIYASDTGFDLYLSGGSITSNTAEEGGGFYTDDMIVYISGTTIEGNVATVSGGGASIVATTCYITDPAVIRNNKAQDGGGLYCSYSGLAMSGGKITGNTADNDGGGVYLGELTAFSPNGGAPTIDGNYLSDGSTNSNLYINDPYEESWNGLKARVAFSDDSGLWVSEADYVPMFGGKIGITLGTDDGYGVFSRFIDTEANANANIGYFYSDEDLGVLIHAEDDGDLYQLELGKIPEYDITLETGDNGTAAVSAETATEGTEITVTATPADGYVVDTITYTVEGSTEAVDITEAGSFEMPAANVTVSVTFKKQEYAITVQTDDNGTATASSETATEGEEITVTATPKDGYVVDKMTYTVDGSEEAVDFTEAGKFTMPAGNVTVSVTFKEQEYDITVTADDNGTATASSETAKEGEEITVTATPKDGYVVDKMTYTVDGSEEAVDFTEAGKFTMPAGNVTVSVTFKKQEYGITIKADDNGTATASSETATEGEEITVTATPKDGYALDKMTYTVDGSTSAEDFTSAGKFTMPAGDVVVNVSFKEQETPAVIQYTVTYDLDGGKLDGQTGNVSFKVDAGTVITLPTPTKDGYTFDYWEGSKYNAGDNYTVNEDHTFKAIWKSASNADKPADSANTGDESNFGFWLMLMLAALSGAAAVTYATARKR